MEFETYQELAKRTINNETAPTEYDKYCNFSMGICGESGEVADYLKKVIFHKFDLDRTKLMSELSDVLWYLSAIATTANISLNEIAMSSLNKLEKRYPLGFDPLQSQNRNN